MGNLEISTGNQNLGPSTSQQNECAVGSQGSEFFCGFVSATFRVSALVLALSTFSTSSSSTASTCSSAPPPAHSNGCNPDALHALIAVLVRCLASAQTCSFLLILFVRAVVERAHAVHERVAEDEDAAYKAACDALAAAGKELGKLRRRLDDCSEKVRERMDDDARWAALATEQQEEERLMAEVERTRQVVDRKKPKEGMKRITGRWGTAVRVSFFLSVFFSQLGGVIAGFAFYYWLQTQESCKFGGFLEIIDFALALGFSLPFHGFFGWISMSQN
ncbi:hypothetical protein VPH35_132853 [Triticum aestivum]